MEEGNSLIVGMDLECWEALKQSDTYALSRIGCYENIFPRFRGRISDVF